MITWHSSLQEEEIVPKNLGKHLLLFLNILVLTLHSSWELWICSATSCSQTSLEKTQLISMSSGLCLVCFFTWSKPNTFSKRTRDLFSSLHNLFIWKFILLSKRSYLCCFCLGHLSLCFPNSFVLNFFQISGHLTCALDSMVLLGRRPFVLFNDAITKGSCLLH